MSATGPESARPRRLDGWAPLERWFSQNPVERWGEVHAALIAVQDHSWPEKYHHVDDVTCRDAVVLFVNDKLILVWRVLPEAPDWYRVVYLGDPDNYAF